MVYSLVWFATINKKNYFCVFEGRPSFSTARERHRKKREWGSRNKEGVIASLAFLFFFSCCPYPQFYLIFYFIFPFNPSVNCREGYAIVTLQQYLNSMFDRLKYYVLFSLNVTKSAVLQQFGIRIQLAAHPPGIFSLIPLLIYHQELLRRCLHWDNTRRKRIIALKPLQHCVNLCSSTKRSTFLLLCKNYLLAYSRIWLHYFF